MTPVYTFWLITALAGVLGLGSLVAGILRIVLGNKPRGVDMLWVFGLLGGMICAAVAGDLSDGPGLNTRTLGAPEPATVSHLTFLNGTFGYTNRLRVDTDHGVYLLDADALIPETGTVYIVHRAKRWNDDQKTFLCLEATASTCWATLRSDP